MNHAQTKEIIERVLAGEIDAYEEIVRGYQQEIWRIAAAMLLNAQRTEDVVQQTFINAYKHLHHFRREKDFGHWLKEIARNAARQELRRQMRESRHLETYQKHLLSVLEGPHDPAGENLLEEALRACSQALPPLSSEMLNLRYQSGNSFTEIAASFGTTVEAARQRLGRIRLVLRECVEKRITQV